MLNFCTYEYTPFTFSVMAKSIEETPAVGFDVMSDRPISGSGSITQPSLPDILASPDGQAVVALPEILDEEDHVRQTTRSKGRIAVICLALAVRLVQCYDWNADTNVHIDLPFPGSARLCKSSYRPMMCTFNLVYTTSRGRR